MTISEPTPSLSTRILRPVETPSQSSAPECLRLTVGYARACKRTMDVLGCLLLALALLILVPLLMIAIKIDSRGPIFFRQRRVGRSGSTFTMYKFRSMHADAEARLLADPRLKRLYYLNGFKLPEADDPRITRVGRVLRKCSLDELPQFWNVLMGQMSLVGPRPITPGQAEEVYTDKGDVCLQVRPGLTGLWQVSGRSAIVGAARVSLDRRYVEEWSIRSDVRILFRTIPAVLTARGAH